MVNAVPSAVQSGLVFMRSCSPVQAGCCSSRGNPGMLVAAGPDPHFWEVLVASSLPFFFLLVPRAASRAAAVTTNILGLKQQRGSSSSHCTVVWSGSKAQPGAGIMVSAPGRWEDLVHPGPESCFCLKSCFFLLGNAGKKRQPPWVLTQGLRSTGGTQEAR